MILLNVITFEDSVSFEQQAQSLFSHSANFSFKNMKDAQKPRGSFFPETIAPHAVIKATQVATFDKTNKAAERNSHDNQQVDQLRYNLPVPAES